MDMGMEKSRSFVQWIVLTTSVYKHHVHSTANCQSGIAEIGMMQSLWKSGCPLQDSTCAWNVSNDGRALVAPEQIEEEFADPSIGSSMYEDFNLTGLSFPLCLTVILKTNTNTLIMMKCKMLNACWKQPLMIRVLSTMKLKEKQPSTDQNWYPSEKQLFGKEETLLRSNWLLASERWSSHWSRQGRTPSSHDPP